ncbi:islet cell autoantigen 1-like isoform X3 [Clupea harengus]|uniref:Islet cell autoantigen 1-like isoform X3 n=1 Tax=Clupea harengus TaxID=7950 RepID=A0A6P8GM76_CLUHA|nr:islet cell autoantigen 1-like isoform X3 [Clupea harengus]
MDGYGFSSDMFSGRSVLGEDSSVMARMQKKFWKTKQVLIKATGKKEDEYVVASDADLDAKLEFFRSVQCTCTELLKVIEKYQQRITHLSQEENELGLFLRFQAEHDKTKAGKMMDATSKALCASAKQRIALCPPLHRMEQEVDTFRRRAIADTLLTVSHMEKSRTEYRGALLWMKDVSMELDPDTYKQLEKFRKVQAQVRTTKVQFDKLKNDVCQKVDMLGASRCNMFSHSLCTYQTTLLQFWGKTAHVMSAIHVAFKGYIPYQFTTLKELRDPLDQLTEGQAEQENTEKPMQTQTDNHVSRKHEDTVRSLFIELLVSLEEENTGETASDNVSTLAIDGQSRDSDSSLCASLDSGMRDLLFDLPQQPSPGAGAAAGAGAGAGVPGETLLLQQEDESERGDMSFLRDLLSPGATASDEFTLAWQDAFGSFESPLPAGPSLAQGAPLSTAAAPSSASPPPSPTGFLPSQLLDHSLSSTGWVTPPMFQAPPLQPPSTTGQAPAPPPQSSPRTPASAPKRAAQDMSAWFNLFSELDPLSNPDAIGRSDEELLNA